VLNHIFFCWVWLARFQKYVIKSPFVRQKKGCELMYE
jgi:hypothetical protein